MAGQVDLSSSKFVTCIICSVTFEGAEFADHDSSEGHQRRKGLYLIDRAIRKVTEYRGCPGPCYPPRGNVRLDG